MDRRFVAWLLITASLFFLWINVRQRFAPPEPVKPANEVESIAANGEGAKAAESKEPALAEIKADEKDPLSGEEAKPVVAEESRIVLGSQAPEDQYRLMVTLSSRGAGIERMELVEQTKPGKFRYRSLQGKGGYLGYLSLQSSSDGLIVGVVPTGSPAANAIPSDASLPRGLQVGDKIVSVDEQPVDSVYDWYQVFQKLKPRTKVKLAVVRPMAGKESGEPLAFEVELTETPMDVVRMTDESLEEGVPGNLLRESCLTTLGKLDNDSISTGKTAIRGLEATLRGNWFTRPLEVENGSGIEFYFPLSQVLKSAGLKGNLELVKRYRLKKGTPNDSNAWIGYDLELETAIRNNDATPHDVSFRQEGFNGLTLEGWWYLTKISPHFFEGAGSRDVVYASEAMGHQMITRRAIYKEALDDPKQPSQLFITPDLPANRRNLKYLGVDAQFFAAALLPHPEQKDSLSNIRYAATTAIADAAVIPSTKQLAANVSNWVETPVVTVAPNSEYRHRYLLFAGPKDPDLLAKHGLDSLLEYGWFGAVAKPLTWILHGFYAICRNYGIAIIMLTVLVRSLMFPLSRRAALNAQKMSELAPEMKRINDLYKDDWEKRTKASQELYKKAKFNPMAGCLPVFVQLPIFMGLYRAVSVDVQLRQQSLIPGLDWCNNLAGPDMLLQWSSWMPDFIAGKGTGWFGPYLNLLPIITVTLFIVQQKVLMPKATDEQQQMTQTMMMYMTVFMGVLFFKVPAGLCIYFITSSIWSLVERQLVKRMTPATSTTGALAVESSTSGSKSASQDWQPKNQNTRTRSQASQRPEKLSDVLPWLNKAKPEPKPEDDGKKGGTSNRARPKKKK